MHPSARSSHELEHLADTLWHERHVAEFLLFKLVSAKLVLAADERRFVASALDEIERVLGLLRQAEATREQAVAAVARLWDQPLDEITLAELAIRSPEPLRTVFRDHQRAFGRMASEIEKTAAANRLLAGAAISHVHRTLDALTGPTVGGTYTADGHHDVALTGPVRLDEMS